MVAQKPCLTVAHVPVLMRTVPLRTALVATMGSPVHPKQGNGSTTK